MPCGRQGLGFRLCEELRLDTLVRCHFCLMSEEHANVLSTCLPEDPRRDTLAVPPRPAYRGIAIDQPINTLQAAERCAKNNSTLLPIAPRTTWQERNLPGRCYRNNSFEVSKMIVSITNTLPLVRN